MQNVFLQHFFAAAEKVFSIMNDSFGKKQLGSLHSITKVNEQVSKNIFNKNDNNVGLLRTVKKVWIQEEHSKQ